MARSAAYRNLVGCSLTALLLASVPSAPLLAQGTQSQGAATYTFAVPQASLESVLTEIGRVGKVTVSAPSDLVAGKTAGPITGTDTVQGALAKALAGSGLAGELKPDGTFVVRRQSAALEGDVPAVDVAAPKQAQPAQRTAQPAAAAAPAAPANPSPNGDVGYAAGSSGNVAGIKNAPAKEIPLSIGVVTPDMIRAQQAGNPLELARNVAGVSVSGDGSYNIRGFNTLDKSTIVNGQRGIAPPSSEILERVEVLKGATSVFTGISKDGGVVNYTTKVASDVRVAEVMTRYDSYYGNTMSLDFGGKVPGTSGLSARIAASGNIDWFRDVPVDARRRDLSVTPSITFKNDVYSHTVSVVYSDQFTPQPTTYLLQATNIAQTQFTGPVRFKPFTVSKDLPWGTSTKMKTFMDDQSLTLGEVAGVKVVANNRFYAGRTEAFGSSLIPNANAPSGWDPLTHGPYTAYSKAAAALSIQGPVSTVVLLNDTLTNRSDLTFSYKNSVFSHTAQIGTDWKREWLKSNNPFNDPHLIVPPSKSYGLFQDTATSVNGTFLNNKLDLLDNKLHLFGSVRKDWWEVNSIAAQLQSPRDLSLDPFFDQSYLFGFAWDPTPRYIFAQPNRGDAVSWSAGGVYDLTKSVSVFYNAAHGVQPGVSMFNAANNNLGYSAPAENKQQEAGFRFTLGQGLQASVTVYDQTKLNIPVRNILTGQSSILSEQNAKGVELQVQGQVTKNIETVFALSRVNVKYGTVMFGDAAAIAGTPPWSGSLWARYKFDQDSVLKGYWVGAGIRGNSGSMMSGPVPNYTLPGYLLADAAVGYTIDNWSITGKVNNVFDKVALTPTTAPNVLYTEVPRAFSLEARVNF